MTVTAPYFGMHDGRVAQGVAPDVPVGALRLWDTGTSWLHIETSPGEFTWTALDTAVATAERSAARPLLVLGQTPTFHASEPRQDAAYGPGAASMPDLAAWRRYVSAVAQRYGDRLDYQIWNEANVQDYWAGTPRQMAELTVRASRIIRDVAPEATIVAPPFALRLRGQQEYFASYWSLHSRGVDPAAAVDAVAVHLYPPAEDPPEAQVELMALVREELADEGVELPVWNTEVNFGLLGGDAPPPIPAERQRAYLMRTYLLNAGLGVARVYWYRWDLAPIANTLLTTPDFASPTSAGRAFATIRGWLGGAAVTGCAASHRVWGCSASRDGGELAFWWKPKGAVIRRAAADADRWVDADGVATRCGTVCRVPVGKTPVMVVMRQ